MNTTFANVDKQHARRAERQRRLAELEAAYEAAVTTNTRSFHQRMEAAANDHLLLDACTTNANPNLALFATNDIGDEEGPTWLGAGEAPTAKERGHYSHLRGPAARVVVYIQQNRLKALLAGMMLVSLAGIVVAFVTPSGGEGVPSSSDSGTGGTSSLVPDFGRAPSRSRADYFKSIIVGSNVSPPDLLYDGDTPQGRAFAWLQDDDSFALYGKGDRYEAETGMEWHHVIEQQAILIRYSLAVLFYSTTTNPAAESYDLETVVVEAGMEERLWNRFDNWLSASSVCSWYGLTCSGLFDETGRVLPGSSKPVILDRGNPILISLNLTSNNLIGTLPSELFTGLGSSLRLLDLKSNDLSSSIPNEVGSASGLHKLDLTSNVHLTGTLPNTMSLISHLQYLFLDGCSLTGTIPPGLKHLSRLQLATYPPSIIEEL
mmetsp:Transcript_17448/g.49934  ORF Transcript_17448/g.49934 Transcript_17448/m.49934 type:complete len:432 (-) Transcript_17448:413-1708(-)